MLCALCREYERQEISHIIPAFVYKNYDNFLLLDFQERH